MDFSVLNWDNVDAHLLAQYMCPVNYGDVVPTGKVRDVYFKGDNVVMITNDRVSAFDFVLPTLIPFKGQVLNKISEWTMGEDNVHEKSTLIMSL